MERNLGKVSIIAGVIVLLAIVNVIPSFEEL